MLYILTALPGLLIAAVVYKKLLDEKRTSRRLDMRAVAEMRTLHMLRANCFITNEHGHRVRYVNASPEARARAETSN